MLMTEKRAYVTQLWKDIHEIRGCDNEIHEVADVKILREFFADRMQRMRNDAAGVQIMTAFCIAHQFFCPWLAVVFMTLFTAGTSHTRGDAFACLRAVACLEKYEAYRTSHNDYCPGQHHQYTYPSYILEQWTPGAIFEELARMFVYRRDQGLLRTDGGKDAFIEKNETLDGVGPYTAPHKFRTLLLLFGAHDWDLPVQGGDFLKMSENASVPSGVTFAHINACGSGKGTLAQGLQRRTIGPCELAYVLCVRHSPPT